MASTKTTAAAAAPSTTPNFVIPTPTAGAGGDSAAGGPVFILPTGTAPFSQPSTGVTGPNSPNFNQGQGTSGSGTNSNLPLIVGVTVGGVVALVILGLIVQRIRSGSRSSPSNSQTRSNSKHNQTGSSGNKNDEERGDKVKMAKSFTIRAPPSVYVEDDQDLDQTGHPHYKSAGDAKSHPYYGGARSPGLVEYELSDTNGQRYESTSVAERKRYVEQQQRKVMEEYEMFNPHKDAPPPSPYPPSSHTPSSYTSGPLSPTHQTMTPTLTPSMGGRSPRVHNNSQPLSAYSRPVPQHHDSTDYKY